jgi:phosphoribosyl 1,2-cyclic phosphodiesterase
MIQIQILASSSKGNAYIIRDGSQSVLIDPGLPYKELQKRSNFTLSELDFALLSHEHADHSKATRDLIKRGLPCLMSKGTSTALNIARHRLILKSETLFKFHGWEILPFEIVHDAVEPLGFLIKSPSGIKICYATDTCYVKYRFLKINYWLIECNHSRKLLGENKVLPQTTKDRITASHFELENVKSFFKAQDLSKTKRIYLIHLSEDNSDPPLFTKEVEAVTGLPVYLD